MNKLTLMRLLLILVIDLPLVCLAFVVLDFNLLLSLVIMATAAIIHGIGSYFIDKREKTIKLQQPATKQ